MNNPDSQHPFIPQRTVGARTRLQLRHRKETRFRLYGFLSILLAATFLGVLLTSVIFSAYPAFFKTNVKLSLYIDPAVVTTETLATANYQAIINDALVKQFPEMTDRMAKRALTSVISEGAKYDLQAEVTADPALIGQTIERQLLASSSVDMAYKGTIELDDSTSRQLNPAQRKVIQKLRDDGRLSSHLDARFWTSSDSREPELAGIFGAFKGSLYLIVICIGIALPLGVAAAVYLEEFASKNKWLDLVEINLNNLAAVPSIVYGLLALALFLNVLDLPRSSALVGGLSLSLLVLPVIIITTRHALKAVPPSIRDGAIGLGASPLQVTFHHVLPAALPGIMTGAILAVARALGETAPLLMVGMVAFVSMAPETILQPATALPVQVYLWSDNPELGFREKTAAAILVLLAVLVTANITAVLLRKRFEQKW